MVFGVFSELCDEVDSRNGLRARARRSREYRGCIWMLKMYNTGLTNALHLLHLVAKLRKHAENHLLPPPASRCASSSSRERERVDACAHTQARPTHPGPRAPHRRQVLMEWWRQQPPVVEAELHLLHVDDLLQPPVAPQKAALAAGLGRLAVRHGSQQRKALRGSHA